MTLEQYESLIASGFFAKQDDVHLINGYVVNRMAESPLHGAVCEAIRMAIGAILLAVAGWHPRGQNGLKIPSQTSIPRPDLAVVRGDWRDYLTRYPEAADAALVVEVSVSSLDEDRAMADIYADGGDPRLLDRQRGRRPGRGLLRPGSIRLSVARGPGARPCAVASSSTASRVGEIPVADILP